VAQPCRVEPFFDPGPWGGQWMRRHFALPDGPANYAWCFDCVPEENALVLAFGSRRFRLPSVMLVHEHPLELLGEDIYNRFGAEFPIRFDLLDTVEGGNLSLQVHPLTEYIREHFGMD
jgi:mannose-6-phosphate isomerase class I